MQYKFQVLLSPDLSEKLQNLLKIQRRKILLLIRQTAGMLTGRDFSNHELGFFELFLGILTFSVSKGDSDLSVYC